MSGPNLDDYIQQGIHGKKEINPDERRRFLGTLRERVVIALTQAQVREQGIYQEVEHALRNNRSAKLFLNGNMNYQYLSKYTKICNKYEVAYTIVTNKEHNSELGLVLAHEYAVDKEDIYVTAKKVSYEEKTDKKGLFASIKKLLKR